MVTHTLKRRLWGPATERDAYIAILNLLVKHQVQLKDFGLKRTNMFLAEIAVEIEGESRVLDAFVGEFETLCSIRD